MGYMDFYKKIATFGLASSLGLAAFGCGGSGSSGSPAANPYAGNYSGDFVDQNDFIGPFTMTVSSSGALSGQFGYATPITYTGSIVSAGTGSITGTNGTFQVTLGGSGHTTLGGGIGAPTNGAFITLASNPTGTFSGFSGDYAGTVHNTTLGATGIIALSVSSSGAVTGVDLFDVSGTPTLEPIAGTLSSSGALSYTVHGVTVAGTVSLTGETISGSLTESDGDAASLSVQQVSALN
jgi:hypothetical protein